MGYSVSGNRITMTRGDTVKLKVDIDYKQTGEPYEPQEGDVVRFSVKKFVSDRTPLIEKDIPTDSLLLVIDSDDTKGMSFGTYHYDIQLIKQNGDTDTFIENESLQIGPEVN